VANPSEKLLWSIALPGFGQFLYGKIIKGILLILEFLINVQANFNVGIISSFHGEIEKAIGQADYQGLMFYPCLYFFAMWDAWKMQEGEKKGILFFPLCSLPISLR
jgi:TM2 domain-containing membrane protein YozV